MDPTDRHPAPIRSSDAAALAAVFQQHRARLRQIVSRRLDCRLHGRIDLEDVLQESFLSAARRASHLQCESAESAFVWLRLVVVQTLADLHRRHLGAQKRDASRERMAGFALHATSALAPTISRRMAQDAPPDDVLEQSEFAEHLHQALTRVSPADRQILLLRYFEGLSNQQAAGLLGIRPKAASIRYARAMQRLRATFANFGRVGPH